MEMNALVKPDFFVVGAPKSGTTSLYEYLKQHPQVCMPRIKELNFFCTDLHFRFPLLDEKQFLAYFRICKDAKAVGEVSVWNLFSVAAAENIFRFNPEARIIILLRNPVDMMYALHSNHVFNDNEIITDFETALQASEERKKGLRISESIKCPVEGLYYFDVAAYSIQVKRYFDLFGKTRVKVILFDDFIADTHRVYADLLKFIGVDPVFPPGFKIYNASKTTRSSWLKKLTVHAPGWLKSFGRRLFPHQSIQRDKLMFWLWKLNTEEKARPALDPALRNRLAEQMKTEVDTLEKLLDTDLTRWRH